MPAKNTIREFISGDYYHVYNRGVAKQPIFLDAQDKAKFLAIVKRHLDSQDESIRSDGLPYPKYDKDLECLCYCLMKNHFHMLFYIGGDAASLSLLMQASLIAYTMYFNKRYKRVGTLFQGVFRASRIDSEPYLLHISRYIHMNPRTYKTYFYSSLPEYMDKRKTAWIKPERILSLFEGDNYLDFLDDYSDIKAELEQLKAELGNY